ncbi:HAMP domain-containing histidine kinase [Clostridium sardiniense]|uniref:histidine kinase n=1 Tax=Clostridium sardiniense TaxID=29369 RepID=A0ABS7KXZ2_CLOSR|nr:HAMP domain-containing sensor histidine kinase [Clostridium sardiniense]MBY0755681.1 HAMP domain-containing histidine kinase [Clostridium sardiniense]MDQ0460091.1 signal transduction histidine kinase [Clostridium sardiniense]
MKSIKSRIIRNFIVVILSTIMILDILLIVFVRQYYYDNAENILTNQIDVATNFYDRYYSTSSLVWNVYDNVDSFWNQTTAQVQMFDENGKLLMDSIGVNDKSLEGNNEVKRALKGESSRWIGYVGYTKYKVMAVTKPLEVNGKIIGVMRFVTSLKDIDDSIASIVSFFIIISVLVLIIGVVLSFIMAKNIVGPILKLKDTAQKMASGDLNQRSNFVSKDEIGQLADTLDFMAEELTEKDQMKNDFISSVSHELRTPLTAIKGWVITLNNDNTDRETLSLGFDILEKETDRLSAMVEELLDFSRLINNKISLNKQPIAIKDFANYIQLYMTPRAERENINFYVYNNAEDMEINIDPNRMKQVLINIIDNAFKFTQEQGRVKVEFIDLESNLIIKVKDDGCGIAADELERVKEKFYKGSNANSNAGIGLSIADEIIKLHGGSLIVRSEINIGTEIEIIIPKFEGAEI